jgi:hypothetical protein
MTEYIAACFPMNSNDKSGDIVATASGATESEAAFNLSREINKLDIPAMRIDGLPVDRLEITIELNQE